MIFEVSFSGLTCCTTLRVGGSARDRHKTFSAQTICRFAESPREMICRRLLPSQRLLCRTFLVSFSLVVGCGPRISTWKLEDVAKKIVILFISVRGNMKDPSFWQPVISFIRPFSEMFTYIWIMLLSALSGAQWKVCITCIYHSNYRSSQCLALVPPSIPVQNGQWKSTWDNIRSLFLPHPTLD